MNREWSAVVRKVESCTKMLPCRGTCSDWYICRPTRPAIKALKEPHRDRKKVKNIKHNGDITIEDIYHAAR